MEDLLRKVKNLYGIKGQNVFLSHSDNIIYKVGSFIIRISDSNKNIDYELTFLSKSKSKNIVKIKKSIDGSLSYKINNYHISVYHFINGSYISSKTNSI